MQPGNEYRALPAKVAQWVLKQVTATWTSYFAAFAAWEVMLHASWATRNSPNT